MRTAIATLAALVFVGNASAGITVTGTGKVTYTPDLAYITVSISSEAKTAAEAWQKNRELMVKIFGVLKEFKVDEKDFKTAGLHLSPKYHHPKDKPAVLLGYVATYDLAITVRKLGDMGKLLDGLVENGANRNVSIGFGIENVEELLEQARLKAVTDARRRADMLVKAAGGSLGALVSVSEGAHYRPQPLRFQHEKAAVTDAAMPIAAGTQDLTVNITVSYTINNNMVASRP